MESGPSKKTFFLQVIVHEAIFKMSIVTKSFISLFSILSFWNLQILFKTKRKSFIPLFNSVVKHFMEISEKLILDS